MFLHGHSLHGGELRVGYNLSEKIEIDCTVYSFKASKHEYLHSMSTSKTGIVQTGLTYYLINHANASFGGYGSAQLGYLFKIARTYKDANLTYLGPGLYGNSTSNFIFNLGYGFEVYINFAHLSAETKPCLASISALNNGIENLPSSLLIDIGLRVPLDM